MNYIPMLQVYSCFNFNADETSYYFWIMRFYFLLFISRESIVFRSNFQSGDFNGFTRFEVPWNRKKKKKTFLAFGLCVCVCVRVCECVCYQHNSKTNYNRNIKFAILHLYQIRMLLEKFQKDRTKTLCTGAYKKF